MIIDFDGMAPSEAYHTMTQTLVPRPVAWVMTENPAGDFNLAPYSFFTAITSNPPILMISAGKKPASGDHKDTRVNIETRRFFTVHIAHRGLAPELTESSRTLPHGESEVTRIGLELADFDGFPMPRLAACRVAMGCELYEIQEMGDGPQTLIFGRIRKVFVADEAVGTDDKGRLRVSAAAVDPIGRLGANEYVTFGDILNIPRPG